MKTRNMGKNTSLSSSSSPLGNVFFLLGTVFFSYIIASASASTPPSGACSTKLNLKPDVVPFDTSSLICESVWSSEDYVLYYNQSEPGLWSFVLSAPDKDAYIGIGFSPDGMMVGSSAVVGWKRANGAGMAYQYYLGGGESKQCLPNTGVLTIKDNKTVIVSQSSRLYLAFQLINTSQPLSKLIYSVGPKGAFPGNDLLLMEHADKVSTTIKYATLGSSSLASPASVTAPTESSMSTSPPSPSDNHGLRATFGWSIFVPIIIASMSIIWH